MEALFHVATFYVFAAFALAGAAISAFSRRLVYCVFALLLTFLGVAGLYVLLSADFLAAVQVLLYAGGILVLLIFGVMLTHEIADVSTEANFTDIKFGAVISGILWLLLVVYICKVPWAVLDPLPPYAPTTRAIGLQFLGDYLVPFEYSSFVLLLVVLGAATLARKEVD